jgi:MYXO-CTERM domain-containing protein
MPRRHPPVPPATLPPLFRAAARLLLALAGFFPLAGFAQTNLIDNPGFEDVGFSGGNAYRYLKDNPEVVGPWTFSYDNNGESSYLGSTPTYASSIHDGTYGVTMKNGDLLYTGGFDVVTGESYTLSFFAEANSGGEGPFVVTITDSTGLTTIDSTSFQPTVGYFSNYTFDFTSTLDGTAKVRFNLTSTFQFDSVSLDDVSVVHNASPVPEPPACAAFAGLAAAAGAWMSRRRNKRLHQA